MGQFVVHIVAPAYVKRPDKPPVAVIYEGDYYADAIDKAYEAQKNPQYKGQVLRFFNFSLFGGGMKDTPITGLSA
jgi:hypothetical protein